MSNPLCIQEKRTRDPGQAFAATRPGDGAHDLSPVQPGREVLLVIPARGGSKGIPRKNIIDLAGLPLIAYSILPALAAGNISRVVVSTDDQEIASIAKDHGAEVPTLRPGKMAGDTALVGEAVRHMTTHLRETEGYEADVVAVTYPTHLLKTRLLLEDMIDVCLRGYAPMITVKRVSVAACSLFIETPDGHAPISLHGHRDCTRVVDYVRPYGMLHATRPGTFRPYNWQLEDPLHLFDIDTFEDLSRVERFLIEERITMKDLLT